VGEPERVLSLEEAAITPAYVTYYYEGDRLAKVENIRENTVQSVKYLDRPWPDEELLVQHRRDYGAVPFQVLTQAVGEPTGTRRRLYHIDAAGAVVEYAEHEFDERGDLIAESRYTPDGELFERTEYVYDDGELVLTRELDPDGTILSEWESP
jgi:hypothetical protein